MIELLLEELFGISSLSTGSYTFICILIMSLVCLMLLKFGLDFDFSLLMTAPLPYGFYKMGYIPDWVSGIMILIVLGFSIYMIWIKWNNKV